MGKSIDDICILVQARLGSQRVPRKMVRPFAGSTLLDILLEKLSSSTLIPISQVYLSAYEDEIKEIGRKHSVSIYSRSRESAFEEKDMKVIFEWYKHLPYKYVVLVSACNPLLKLETIENFIQSFVDSDKEGCFGVFEKKTYYWNKEGESITDWKGQYTMNTKYVEPVYEAAHCLYASNIEFIGKDRWMDLNTPPQPNLFVMNELETFDIDYEWEFQVGEKLYESL